MEATVSTDLPLESEPTHLADRIGSLARSQPDRTALRMDGASLSYAELDERMDRIAAGLQRDGVRPGDTIAIAAGTSLDYLAVFLAAGRAGAAAAPLPPGASPESLAAMLADASPTHLFLDGGVARALAAAGAEPAAAAIALDDAGPRGLAGWLPPAGTRPAPVPFDPHAPYNLIYSSGTTGTPKGIVHSNLMRWVHVERAAAVGYGGHAVNLVSTPLYSNTTLVSVLPTVSLGGTLVMMGKFDPGEFLRLAERNRVTHAMLVPVQYRRLLDHPDFDRFDLSSFQVKYCTSAPFSAELKAEVLRRWPGGLVEIFGMTEGGGTTILVAHAHPDKLHTVGQPVPGHDIRLLDDEGREVPVGEVGEIVGHSPMGTMLGYHRQPELTAAVEWRDAAGRRFIRTGDLGRFDEDGFLTLVGRKKDMIISGGFNIYPIDLETVLAQHPAVAEVAVVGVASRRWGETPVAFAVLAPGGAAGAGELCAWANQRLGKMQRIAAVEIVDSLPRNAIGKVLKRELRDRRRDRPLD
jgi:acyl-CoA synthetase (AMP-forming)/AMP-acid ligase II